MDRGDDESLYGRRTLEAEFDDFVDDEDQFRLSPEEKAERAKKWRGAHLRDQQPPPFEE